MTKKSQRTKDVSKLARIFFVLSCLCFLGVAVFSVVAIFSRVGGSEKQGMENTATPKKQRQDKTKKILANFDTSLVL